MALESWFFILVSFLFSIVYAKIETGLDDWWLLLAKKDKFWRKKFGKYTPYHLYMLVLDLVVNLPALYFTGSVSLYLACILIFPLVEDIAYFLWLKKWIKPGDWTAKEGSVSPFGKTIPYWYLIMTAIIAVLLLVSFNFG